MTLQTSCGGERVKAIIHCAQTKNPRVIYWWVPGVLGLWGKKRHMLLQKVVAASEENPCFNRAIFHTNIQISFREVTRK